MPFCGYDPLMGAGVASFGDGLSKSMGERAERLSLGLKAQLSEEKDELFLLIHFLENELRCLREADPHRRRIEAFLGVAYIARFLMGLEQPAPGTRAEFDERIGLNAMLLDEMMAQFEAVFESAPRDQPTLDRAIQAFDRVFAVSGSTSNAAKFSPFSQPISLRSKAS